VVSVTDKIGPAYFIELNGREGNVPYVGPVNFFPSGAEEFLTGQEVFVKIPVAAFASHDPVYGDGLHAPVYFVFGFQYFLHVVEGQEFIPVGIHEVLDPGKNGPVPGAVKILGGLNVIGV